METPAPSTVCLNQTTHSGLGDSPSARQWRTECGLTREEGTDPAGYRPQAEPLHCLPRGDCQAAGSGSRGPHPGHRNSSRGRQAMADWWPTPEGPAPGLGKNTYLFLCQVQSPEKAVCGFHHHLHRPGGGSLLKVLSQGQGVPKAPGGIGRKQEQQEGAAPGSHVGCPRCPHTGVAAPGAGSWDA